MVKQMLSVLMDGIKDANMIIDYAEEAERVNDNHYQWFMDHARERVDQVCEDYKSIDRVIMLEQKAMSGDDIALALMEHLKSEMSYLKARIS